MTDEELRRLAEAATPGPWFAVQPKWTHGWWIVSTEADGTNCIDDIGEGGFLEANARLIAAMNPAAVLALLDRLRDAEAQNVRLRGVLLWRAASPGGAGKMIPQPIPTPSKPTP